jgi:hypothetical protein
MILGHILPKKIRPELIELADRLYNYLPPVCWRTEKNIARDIGASLRQIRYAKALLEQQGRIWIRPSLSLLNYDCKGLAGYRRNYLQSV